VKSHVAHAALEAGALGINDVSAGRLDAAMFRVVAAADAGVVLMHSRGGSVGALASYALAPAADDDITSVVLEELALRVDDARAAGVRQDAIVVDPGIGFAKTTTQSVTVLRELDRLTTLGCPVLVGASRKRVIGELVGRSDPTDRTIGSVVAHVCAVLRGARIVRVHDVAATRDALRVLAALTDGMR
jgi:dihydropteroate synthase